MVQDYIRPNYEAENSIIIYFLVSNSDLNFLPGIGLPSLFYVTIPEIFKPNTSIYRNNHFYDWSKVVNLLQFTLMQRSYIDWNDGMDLLCGGIVLVYETQKNTKL